MDYEAVWLMWLPDFRPLHEQWIFSPPSAREVCPSEVAPLLSGAPMAFRQHVFRWSSKACAHCGLALSGFGGSQAFLGAGDDPTPEDWGAYVQLIERGSRPST